MCPAASISHSFAAPAAASLHLMPYGGGALHPMVKTGEGKYRPLLLSDDLSALSVPYESYAGLMIWASCS